jgi:ABC-type cobalamin/Fe3+-siderophores transport system ATPase subunit
MKGGQIIHQHQKKDELNISIIKKVFDVDATIINLPNQNRQWVSF